MQTDHDRINEDCARQMLAALATRRANVAATVGPQRTPALARVLATMNACIQRLLRRVRP